MAVNHKKTVIRAVLSLSIFCFLSTTVQCSKPSNQDSIVIGCKNFTEQIILGELFAQMIEEYSDLQVVKKWNLGGTMICHQAIVNSSIDLYPEYTGTAYITILKKDSIQDSQITYQAVQKAYREQFKCEWLPSLGFNNTYTITVRKSGIRDNGWNQISDLSKDAPQLTAGFTAEFFERQDGYPGLKKQYGFSFGNVVNLDPGLMYQAIANNKVDVICGFSTDGRIQAYDLQPLTDDLNYFPPYYAAPVIRLEILKRYPYLKEILSKLGNTISNQKMQKLNLSVDEEKQSPADVVSEFLQKNVFTTDGSLKEDK